MMRRLRLVLYCQMIALTLGAFEMQQIADTLNAFLSGERIRAGEVRVRRVFVKQQNVSVYTNGALQHVSFSEAQLDSIYALVGVLVLGEDEVGQVNIYSESDELRTLLTARHRPRSSKSNYAPPATHHPIVVNSSATHTAKKGLENRHIALWGSHGLYFEQEEQRWKWQRARLWTTVEDVYTTSYVQSFLVPMLENAGAYIFQPRERDPQPAEYVIDDADATQDTAIFLTQDGAGWKKGRYETLLEGENPFANGDYKYAHTSRRHVATLTYVPKIAHAGEYGVYISYQSLPNSADEVEYTVAHAGEKTTFIVNQTMGGGTWIYLGNFYFDKLPENNYVAVSNKGHGRKVITSDAVRFGGGMGSVARYVQPPKASPKDTIDSLLLQENRKSAECSGVPRFFEGARYWLQYAGIPDSVYNFSDSYDDYRDDYSCRGRWVNYLLGGSNRYPQGVGLKVPIDLSLAFHTDAGMSMDNAMIGTLAIYTLRDDDRNNTFPGGVSRIVNKDLGDYVQHQIVNDMRSSYAPEWPQRQLRNASYSESRNPKVPSMLLELLSHQNYADMHYGLDPRVKFIVSRAIYKGILKFIHQQNKTPYVVQPLPITHFNIQRNEDTLRLHWLPQQDTLEGTATPTYYVLYMRQDSGDWDNGMRLNENNYAFIPKKNVHYDFKIAAGNDGGISMPSEELCARIDSSERGNVLIINAFTRVSGPEMFAWDSLTAGIVPYSHAVPYKNECAYIGEQIEFDRTKTWESDDNCGFGMCANDQQFKITVGNTFNYPRMHGQVLAKMNYSYVSTSLDALDAIPDSTTIADVICGEQKRTVLGLTTQDTAFQIFPENLRNALEQYANANGNILLAGAYIGSDLHTQEQIDFAESVLHYKYRTYHASYTGIINFRSRSFIRAKYHLNNEPNNAIIACNRPDGIEPAANAIRLARYSDSGVGAAIAYKNTNKTIALSFCLESLHEFENLYKHCIEWLEK